MKFKITLKDPDGISNAVRQAAEDSFSGLPLKPDELADAVDLRQRAIMEDFLSQWVKYDEYITIEFDPIAKTARVVPLK